MAAQELFSEYMALALETTRGTGITQPTHKLTGTGTITPNREMYYSSDNYGVLAEYTRSKTMRTGAEWTNEGDLDIKQLPVLLNMVLAAVTSPSTPTNGVLTRLWTFTRTMTADSIKAATLWWTDPNAITFKSVYAMAQELTVSAGTDGTDPMKFSINGIGQFPSTPSTPSEPALTLAPLLVPYKQQLWIDTATIGTTAISGRFISGELTMPTGVVPKYLAQGPTGAGDYTRVGRERTHPTLKLRFELADSTQLSQYTTDTDLKVRWRVSGDLIESVTPDYYYYFEADVYGKFAFDSWSDLEGTNRVIDLVIEGEYNTTAATDLIVRCQNINTAL